MKCRRSAAKTPTACGARSRSPRSAAGSDSAALPAPPPPPPPPAVGMVLLRNYSDVTGTFVVNGQPYAVSPGQVLEVRNVPAGTFQLPDPGRRLRRHPALHDHAILPAGGMYTLNIDPRPQAIVLVP